MTSVRLTSAVLAAFMFSTPARGQQLPVSPPLAERYVDAADGIGLDAAIARALDREPSLHAARADIDVARGQRRQAALRPNPSLSLERREQPSGPDHQSRVAVQWPLDLFRRGARVASADRQIDVSRFAAADRERLLISDVRQQYGMAAVAIRDVRVADELLTAFERQLELVRARVAEGSTPSLERDLLEVEVRRIDAERLLAAGRADVALVQLKPLLGMPQDEPLRLRETIETLVAAGPAAAGVPPVTVPATERPDVREAAARVDLAEALVDQARREGRFDVGLFGMYMRMADGVPQQSFTNVSAGVMVMVPLFNRNQGQVAAAHAELAGAEARRDVATLAAQAEVAAARARDAQALRAADMYRDRIHDLARQNLDVVQQTFELGRATVFDVLAEQRRYLDIERDYTAALREAWEARVALSRALGETR